MSTWIPREKDGLLERLLQFVPPQAEGSAHSIHNLHPYPAKYIPHIPAELISEHTNERHLVLDPFCGSGTTLVEAALRGRKSYGIDSNPIACLVSRAKTTPLGPEELAAAQRLLEQVASVEPAHLSSFRGHIISRQEHWFQENMLAELDWLRSKCRSIRHPSLRNFLLCVFSSIIVSASNQDSETRYEAIQKNLQDGYALARFRRRLAEAIAGIKDYSSVERTHRNIPLLLEGSADIALKNLPSSAVDLIVTSPPYPNSFDYYLYHKLRMAWLGFDYREVMEAEIGSRYEHSSRKAPIDRFIVRMQPVMTELARVLKPAKLAYFFVGDSVVAGEHIDMSEVYCSLGEEVGLKFLSEITYDMRAVSRSFTTTREAAGGAHKHKKLQRVVVFEGTSRYESRPAGRRLQAVPQPSRSPLRLSPDVADGAVLSIESDDQDRHVHSLAFFPSKFIPEIPRWAIEQYSSPGAVVLDPFSGSGTTAVEACLAGLSSISVDISPYACLLTQAKTLDVPIALVEREAQKLFEMAKSPRRLPQAKRKIFPLDDFWFNLDHLTEFARLDRYIQESVDSRVRPFFQVALASIVRLFSYQDEDQIKVKRDPKKLLHGTSPPTELLHKKLPRATQRLVDFLKRRRPGVSASVTCASAEDFAARTLREPCADLVVTSPPYINAMNYPMANRYELLLLGLVAAEEWVKHDRLYFGTERVYAREYQDLSQAPAEWASAAHLNPLLAQIFPREKKRSYIAYRFFVSMRASLHAIASALRSGGHFVLVAGNNSIKGIPIDTFQILCTFLEEAGLQRRRSFSYEIVKQRFKVTRHVTAGLIAHDSVGVFMKP
jgi:DNA modification methylase